MTNSFIGKIVGILRKQISILKGPDKLPKPLYNFQKDLEIYADKMANSNNMFDATRIRLAIKLLEIAYNNKYIIAIENSYNFNYGESEVVQEDSDTDSISYSVVIRWKHAYDDDHNTEINARFFQDMTKAHYDTERAKDIAWKIIAKHISV